MQFLIVLAAALACAIAEPQIAYAGYPGYTGYSGYTGYTAGVVPAVGYTGVVGHPGLPAGVAPVAYSAPIAYSGQVGAYPVGQVGAYPVGYSGVYPVGAVKDTSYEIKSRGRRAAVFPLTTAYAHPATYAATPYAATPYAYSPVAYAPAAAVPARYNYGYAYPTVY